MTLENLWQKTAIPAPATMTLPGVAPTYDMVVIGGGFTGCSAALTARELGASVVVFEANTIGYGGSGRNVGLVNAGLWLPPDEIDAIMGQRAAQRLYDVLAAAPDHVFGMIDRLNIDCEARRNGTLHCAHSDKGLADLKSRSKQLVARGAPVEMLDEKSTGNRVGTKAFRGALFDPRAGTINPMSYVRGLAREALRAGADVYENAPVASVQQTSKGWRVMVGDEPVFAKHLLLATNAYVQGAAGIPRPQFTKVGYFQAATRPLGKTLARSILPSGEGCWDTAMVMSSFRLDAEGRLLIGGVGNVETLDRGTHKAWAKRKLAQLFPQLAKEELQETWGGTICMTHDHIPKILNIGPSGYSVFGFSGRGIGPGTVFGALTAEALLKDDPRLLPIAPCQEHVEQFTGLRGAYYELGAMLSHWAAAR